jgi:ABC-type sugar transport system ATPase subunit
MPANRFVASFIGSPSMNIVDVELEQGVFRLGGVEFATEAEFSGPVSVGIRPEALRAGPGIRGDVAWVESLGPQFLVGVRIGDVHLTMLAPERPHSNTIELAVDKDHIHVFEKTTGRTLGGDSLPRVARSQLPAG